MILAVAAFAVACRPPRCRGNPRTAPRRRPTWSWPPRPMGASTTPPSPTSAGRRAGSAPLASAPSSASPTGGSPGPTSRTTGFAAGSGSPPSTYGRSSGAGRVPFIRLMARSGFGAGPDPHFKMRSIARGAWDAELIEWCERARDAGTPLLAEFGTEVNGDWFPWNGRWNGGGRTAGYGNPELADGPESFRNAYRRIVDICRAQGANDITWFFHVDVGGSPTKPWNRVARYYPGDAYIDWIGISDYGPLRPGQPWVGLPAAARPLLRSDRGHIGDQADRRARVRSRGRGGQVAAQGPLDPACDPRCRRAPLAAHPGPLLLARAVEKRRRIRVQSACRFLAAGQTRLPPGSREARVPRTPEVRAAVVVYSSPGSARSPTEIGSDRARARAGPAGLATACRGRHVDRAADRRTAVAGQSSTVITCAIPGGGGREEGDAPAASTQTRPPRSSQTR